MDGADRNACRGWKVRFKVVFDDPLSSNMSALFACFVEAEDMAGARETFEKEYPGFTVYRVETARDRGGLPEKGAKGDDGVYPAGLLLRY